MRFGSDLVAANGLCLDAQTLSGVDVRFSAQEKTLCLGEPVAIEFRATNKKRHQANQSPPKCRSPVLWGKRKLYTASAGAASHEPMKMR